MGKHKKNQKAKKLKRERRRVRMDLEWDRTIKKEQHIALKNKLEIEQEETEKAIIKFNELKEKGRIQL